MTSALALIDPAGDRNAAADRRPVATVHLIVPIEWQGSTVSTVDLASLAKARRDKSGNPGLDTFDQTVRAAAIMTGMPVEFLARLCAADVANILVVAGALLVEPTSN